MVNASVPRRSSSSGSAPASSAGRGRSAGIAGNPLASEISPRDAIVRDVVLGLYEGRYRPGQRLVESQLTATYGVSRGPVREALNRLAAAGAVVLTLQSGAQIRMLTRPDAVDILVVATSLVKVAARLAALRIDTTAAARLQATLDRLVRSEPSNRVAGYALARSGFYATLTQIAGNAELRRLLPDVQIHLIRVQFGESMTRTNRHRVADYERIAAAILAGKPAAAEAAVQRHFNRAIEDLSLIA